MVIAVRYLVDDENVGLQLVIGPTITGAIALAQMPWIHLVV